MPFTIQNILTLKIAVGERGDFLSCFQNGLLIFLTNKTFYLL